MIYWLVDMEKTTWWHVKIWDVAKHFCNTDELKCENKEYVEKAKMKFHLVSVLFTYSRIKAGVLEIGSLTTSISDIMFVPLPHGVTLLSTYYSILNYMLLNKYLGNRIQVSS
uniref:Uncharacterized protein n=1 Tax=Romanomermis culicivorax TaxID=13658 RepID=A0A915JL59_ROMCU